MGGTKKWMERQWEGGYNAPPNKKVCANCVVNEALADVVRQSADGDQCDYCGKEVAAISMDVVIEHMADCINEEFGDEDEELPFDKETGRHLGAEAFDSEELLDEIGFEGEGEFREDVVDVFSYRRWCRHDPFLLDPAERRKYGWENFKRVVQHQRRYTFWDKPDDVEERHPDDLPVGEMLDEIADIVRDENIFKILPPKSRFWRVRVGDNEFLCDRELSPPPEERANQANRMSPPGISMFYGADDFDTACIETLGNADDKKLVTGAKFVSVRELLVLDLVELPRRPDFFEKGTSDTRYNLAFLHAFARDIAKPIDADGGQHVKYVPTQAFTEYVRYRMKIDDKNIDGIRYKSSKNGKPCIVLFCGQDSCVEHPSQRRWLSFDGESRRTVSVAEIRKRQEEFEKMLKRIRSM